MRTTRFLLPVAVAAVVVAPIAASATTTSSTGLPSELTFFQDGCGGASAVNYTHMVGPAGALNSGSLRFNVPRNDAAEIDALPPSATETVNALPALNFMYYLPATAPAGVSGAVVGSPNPGAPTPTVDLAFDSPTTVGSWGTADLLNDPTIHWVLDAQGASPTSGSGTWADFKSLAGTDTVLATALVSSTCGGPLGFANVDNVDLGTGTTYDFEPAPATADSVSTSKSAIVYGNSVTVRTHLTSASGSVAGERLRLLARKAGTTIYKQIGSATTNSSGVASLVESPKVNTTYKWVFDGNPNLAPSASPTKFVGVARQLTIKFADTTLTATQQLKVHGAETPALRGQTVSIWRHNSAGTTKIGTTTIRSDGTWSFAHSFPTGKYSVYARVPKDATHVAGQSRSVTVSSA